MKRIFLLCLFASLLSFTSQAQEHRLDSAKTIKDSVKAPKEQTFTSVEIQAEFPGGSLAWEKYLSRNLNSDVARQNNAPIGKYTVKCSFIVDKNGDVTDISTTNPGYGMAEEVLRVIKNCPKWMPGFQNGRYVKSWRTQNITFQVEGSSSLSDSSLKITPAEFPGGHASWISYLTNNIKYDIASQNNAPAGKYLVKAEFSIDKNGRLVEIKIINDPGYGTADEVFRVLNNSPQWKAGLQNGQCVKSTNTQRFNFEVADNSTNKNLEEVLPPEFPNTDEAWKAFLTRHLDFDIARKKGAPLGQYIVHVKFNVDTRGRVVDVETENDPGYGMVKEAIRVIKESPRWYPATRNGVPYKAQVKQGISFVVR